MLVLSAAEVRRCLPMADAVEATKQAFAALSRGGVQAPPRASLGEDGAAEVTLVMAARMTAGRSMTVKAVSVFPRNAAAGIPVIHSAVLVVDPETGKPLALIEGASMTAIRTGAASGAAADLLARPDSRVLAVFGAGPQAATQAEAVCTVRPIEAVRIYARDQTKAREFASGLAGRGGVPDEVTVATSPREALADADVVCTATTSSRPVFEADMLRPGCHINAVGSFRPQVAEIPPETVAAARVWVDHRESAWEEAGDLIQALEARLIAADHIVGELGELVDGGVPGRQNAAELTLFKSVGHAVQDAAAAAVTLAGAERLGLGTRLDW